MNNKNIPLQFLDNLGVMTKEEYLLISNIRVLIIGLGGLGGNVANNLVRLGVKHLKLVDFDSYEETNLNRQLFSTIKNIGNSKVEVIKEELLKINPDCQIEISTYKIQNLSQEDIGVFDYIIDTVDNLKTKIYLAKLSERLNIPLLHGACAGWYGQVGWILPGNKLIQDLYGNEEEGIEKQLKNPSFTPTIVSAIMVAEFLKMIQKSDKTTVNELLLIDVFNNSFIKTGRN